MKIQRISNESNTEFSAAVLGPEGGSIYLTSTDHQFWKWNIGQETLQSLGFPIRPSSYEISAMPIDITFYGGKSYVLYNPKDTARCGIAKLAFSNQISSPKILENSTQPDFSWSARFLTNNSGIFVIDFEAKRNVVEVSQHPLNIKDVISGVDSPIYVVDRDRLTWVSAATLNTVSLIDNSFTQTVIESSSFLASDACGVTAITQDHGNKVYFGGFNPETKEYFITDKDSKHPLLVLDYKLIYDAAIWDAYMEDKHVGFDLDRVGFIDCLADNKFLIIFSGSANCAVASEGMTVVGIFEQNGTPVLIERLGFPDNLDSLSYASRSSKGQYLIRTWGSVYLLDLEAN